MGKYDYIITGAGASGLSLLVHLIHSGKFSNKKILLLDRAPKTNNDRTWCFWETDAGLFEGIVYKRWEKLWFHGIDGASALHDIHPYQYKLIRGIDFYNYCFELIATAANIEVQYGKVEGCFSEGNTSWVVFKGEKIFAEYIFNSILFEKPVGNKKHSYLLQHFKGWFIKSAAAVFNPGEAILMDFRVGQKKGTTFVYVMPFTENEALVEYTLFSENLLRDAEYNEGLEQYCSEVLELKDYTVGSEEFGVIPMTDYHFPRRQNNIINIGTAGGQTKASSGYTFKFIQKDSRDIVEAMVNTGKPFVKSSFFDRRFDSYDSTLLNILSKNKYPGAQIFTTLMNRNKMTGVFRFLDNDTSLLEEMKIISPLPKGVFLRSFIDTII